VACSAQTALNFIELLIDGLDLMARQWELTPEGFKMLLAWLDKDREQAGKKYEHIRQSLVKIFIRRGCDEAEDLADITINRVAGKFPELTHTYVGDPALYFYGVAKNVAREHQKHESNKAPLPILSERDDMERKEAAAELEHRYECLEQCLRKLNDDNRELITRYYQRERQAKIDSRRELSKQLDISPLALRVRVHRLRNALYQCIQECLALKSK
jgi:RNA polymerase sigma factor (sigma-70 family)